MVQASTALRGTCWSLQRAATLSLQNYCIYLYTDPFVFMRSVGVRELSGKVKMVLTFVFENIMEKCVCDFG